MTLLTQADLPAQATFLLKLEQAALATAIAIGSEGSGVANHVNRAAYAKAVLGNPTGFAPLIAKAYVSDGISLPTDTDTAINTRVSAIWNALAGN